MPDVHELDRILPGKCGSIVSVKKIFVDGIIYALHELQAMLSAPQWSLTAVLLDNRIDTDINWIDMLLIGNTVRQFTLAYFGYHNVNRIDCVHVRCMDSNDRLLLSD